MSERKREKYFLILMIGVLAASLGPTLIKLTEAPALTIATYRMIFASTALVPIVTMKGPQKVLSLGRKKISLIILAGILLAIHFGSWMKSLDYISVPPAILLTNSHPAFVALLSYLILKERVGKREMLGIIIVMGGMGVIIYPDITHFTSLFGGTLAVMGAISFGCYLVVGRNLRQKLPLLPYIFPVYLVATVVLVPVCIFSGGPFWGYAPQTYLLMLAIGLISTLIPHSSFNWSIKYLKPTVVSIVAVTIPIFASLIAWLVLAEVLTLWTFGGGALIVSGIYLVSRS